MKTLIDNNKNNENRKLFDIIICDPPKLATTVKGMHKAINKYVEINTCAMKLIINNGLLFTFSCSGVITQQNK